MPPEKPPKRDRPSGGTPPTKKTKDKTQAASESEPSCTSGDDLGEDAEDASQAVSESNSLCVTCEKSIDDNGLLCEFCYQWEHNQCATISDEAYSILSDSPPNIMFFCTACRPKVTGALKFFNEMHDNQINLDKSLKELEVDMQSIQKDLTERVSRLEKQINQQDQLKKKMNDLEANLSVSSHMPTKPQESNQPSTTDASSESNFTAAPHRLHLASHQSAPPVDRKFNIVIYGLRESPVNTNRHNRMQHDLDCLMTMFSELKLNNITHGSLKDFYRLGKYDPNKERPRPILVKFLRAFDASLVLSSKKALSPGVTIKPDMSADERKTESILLKERRNLITNKVTEGKFIKVTGKGLYVNRNLYAVVQNSQLCIVSNSLVSANTANANQPTQYHTQSNATTATPANAPTPMDNSS